MPSDHDDRTIIASPGIAPGLPPVAPVAHLQRTRALAENWTSKAGLELESVSRSPASNQYGAPLFVVVGNEPSDPIGFTQDLGSIAAGKRLFDNTSQPSDAWQWMDLGRLIVAGVSPVFTASPDEDVGHLGRLLLKHRPEMPLNGVVALLDASSLVVQGAVPASETMRVAEQIVTATNWQVPYYIVLTGLDKLAGFAQVSGVLSQEQRQAALGYCYPRKNESGSTQIPDLADAGRDVVQTLQGAVYAIALESPLAAQAAVRRELLRFIGATQDIESGLAVNLSLCTSKDKGLQLRGIYCCACGLQPTFVQDLIGKMLPRDGSLAHAA